MTEALHFLRPWWLLALLPAIALTLAWARHRVSGSHWEASIAPELLAVLLETNTGSRMRILAWVVALALALCAIGLAGPTWERLPQPVEQKNDALIIALDLSLSMFAKDIAPSRLVRARQKVTDILRLRNEGFTALVAYAGDAHAVAPLTDDTHTIENLLAALSPEMMPVFGSKPSSALEVAHQLFANAHVNQGRILLVTDGVDRITDVTKFRDPRFPISILGLGTTHGADIPLDFVNQPGRVLQSDQGDAIIARLDEERLADIARLSHGRYRTLTLNDSDIRHVLAAPLPQDDETLEVDREFDVWADSGYWVCVILLPLLLLGFRRGVFAMLCIAVLPPPAHAGIWEDLWQRRDQQAHHVMLEGAPDRAALLFTDPQWRASAQYRSGDFPGAAEGFSVDESLDGYYNLGNALAKLGDFSTAISAYEETLKADPQHEDALFNKDLLEQLLEEQESSESDSNEQQQQGDSSPQDSSEPQDGSDAQQQPDQQQGQDPEQPENQDSEDQENQADENSDPTEQEMDDESRDEKLDALEQWLRRVPDDPGGLLRRKFRYESNQRRRRGDYQYRETEKIW